MTPEIVTAAVMDLARALLADPATFAGSRLDSAQQERLRAFYAARQEPLWLRDGGWNEGARQTQARMERAWEEGLESADYPAPALAAGATPAALAEAEVRQSVNAVKYARDASGARIDPARLSRLLTPRRDLPDADRVLAGLAVAMQRGRDAGDALAAWNPSHAGYQALRARLIALRAARPPEPAVARIPHGPPLRVGMQDPRVKLVRSRLGLTPSDDVSYDERLAAAVAEFQRSRGLKPTGVLTRQTVLAMTGGDIPREEDESLLVVNMERWRWLPRDLGDDYVFVNIPEFRMRLVREGRLAFETRIIVGKPETPTPVFSHEIQYVVLNPYWTVPPSILKKEFLPALARDPQYAARRGYEVIRRGDRITVRQPPGERNALGRIKFMFPNDHAVYLHDTPNRGLFGRNRRAFSHGCVRVDDPLAFATLALGPEWPEQRIRRLLGKGERTVRLARPLPVHLAYFTASVDAGGTMHAREDIYGVDARMRAALARLRGAP
ncbi:murein L,D-transpeptidase [Camelimonas abortus]|uniref:Murein L,D-transpeptidase n=1 Tax=Camelimonas abortus TaxID=1017184 RepID=A0ABV7LF62_9HYPH